MLITGYDIIFFWVARMMMFCTLHRPEVPFRQVMVHGLVRDARGRKMSKSAGNGIDPLELIDYYGTDALRWTLARAANPGGDVPLSEEWVQGSRNFVNKLWNATRFALMNGADPALPLDEATAHGGRPVDPLPARRGHRRGRRALRRLRVRQGVRRALPLRLGRALRLVRRARRRCRCAAKRPTPTGTRAVLGRCLDTVLRLLHPVIPFVTDELWRSLNGYGDGNPQTLALAEWPADPGRRDPAAAAELARLQELVIELRRFRTQQGIASRRKIGAVLLAASPDAQAFAAAWSPQLASLAELTIQVGTVAPDGWETLTAGGMSVALDLLGSIDVGAEKARLTRALEAAAKEIAQTGGKLGNQGFLAKAPEKVVAEIRARHDAAVAEHALLTERLGRLG